MAKPQLKENYLNHPWGTIGTEFVFKVKYFDDSGKDPQYVKIFISDTSYDMKKISGSPKTGEVYQYSFVAAEKDAYYHVYYYEASDGTETVRHFDLTTADQTFGGPLILKSRLDNNKIYLFSRESNNPLWRYSIGKDWVLNVDIADDAKTVVAKTSDYIYTFSKEGKLLWKHLTGLGNANNNDPSGFAAVSADGEKIFAGGGGQMYSFKRSSNSPVWQYKIDAGVYNIQMSKDNKYVAVGRYDDRLDLVDGTNGNILWHYDVDGGFHALGISADGNHIIGGTHCPDREGYLFFKESNKPVWKRCLNEQGSPVWCGAISSDGNYIVFGLDGSDTEQADIFFFSKDSNEPLWTYNLKNWVRSVAISADGNLIVAGTGDKQVLLFSKENNVPVWEYNAEDKVGAVDITPDGNYIVAGTKAKEILLFSKENNTPLWKFKATDWVNWVALSPDGNYIVASTGAPQYIYEGHSESTNTGVNELVEEVGDKPTGVNCGDGICDFSKGETKEGCPQDCSPGEEGSIESQTYDQEKGESPPKTYCGNSVCEEWTENKENCPQDCEKVLEEERKEGILQSIINFFRRLLGR